MYYVSFPFQFRMEFTTTIYQGRIWVKAFAKGIDEKTGKPYGIELEICDYTTKKRIKFPYNQKVFTHLLAKTNSAFQKGASYVD